MNLFRLQNNTPPVYTDESRDFQLLCRLYDAIYAGFKYDVDQIPSILDPFKCRDNLLPLLETRLGFFTNKMMDDTAVRFILDAFPYLVRNKGSLKGVQAVVNTYLKIHDVRTRIIIYAINEDGSLWNVDFSDHTIVVAINETIKDIKILEELLKYVMPPGFNFQFYFFRNIEDALAIQDNIKADLIFISDNINAQIRQEHVNETADKNIDNLVGAVDTMNLASTDSKLEESSNG